MKPRKNWNDIKVGESRCVPFAAVAKRAGDCLAGGGGDAGCGMGAARRDWEPLTGVLVDISQTLVACCFVVRLAIWLWAGGRSLAR